MGSKVEDTIDNLRWAPASVVNGASHLVKLRKMKDPWTVIDEIIKFWEASAPKEYKSFVFHLKDTKDLGKETQVGNKKFRNVSIDKTTGGMLQRKIDIPLKVVYMIRALYSPEELPMDREFMEKFGKRYPNMLIAEVV